MSVSARTTAPNASQIRELIRRRDLAELASQVRALAPDEIGRLLDDLEVEEAAVVFRLLRKDEAIGVFEAMSPRSQAAVIAELGDSALSDVFAALDPEDQAWLLDELPAKVAGRIITACRPESLSAAMGLLGYGSGSTGRRMSPVALRAHRDESVGALLDRVRASSRDTAMLAAIPVTTADRTLAGSVELAEVLRADPDEPVETVMDADPVSARTDDDVEHTARKVLDAGVLVLPVVDREQRLVGVLPMEDAARIDYWAAVEDQARAGATEPLRRPYLRTPVLAVTRARIVWLLVLAVSAILTVNVLEMFEATLEQRVTLALFVPLLIGIAGNTGSQAATTVTRALAVGEVTVHDLGRVAFKEMRTGASLGIVLAAVAFSVASVVYGVDIGAVLAVTLMLSCPGAATVGGVIPLVARWCRVDPAVFSTPFISTFCDASGLLIYFAVAIAILGL